MRPSPTLHIVCPTQKRGFPAFMSVVFVWVVASGLGNGWEHDGSFGFMLLTVGALVIMVLAAWALYRNFVFQDALYIAREGSLPSSVPLALMVHDIRAVRLLPKHEAWTPEGKWDALGFGQGRIEIDTATHRYHFGIGLEEHEAEAALHRIIEFCREQGIVAAAA